MEDEVKGKAKGGIARAAKLTPEERKEIAQKAAIARWGYKPHKSTHRGNFKDDFGIDVDCYVLDDEQKTAVITQRGMGEALGMGRIGSRFPRLINGKTISEYIGPELRKKLENPLIFQGITTDPSQPSLKIYYGFDVTLLIDVCKAIIEAESAGKLTKNQRNIARQAHIIVNASAKAGIKGLVYALAGYDATKEEVISAFKLYVQQEAKKYEKEFPSEIYAEWQRLYNITPPPRGKNWKEMHLTVDHIYYPLAKSNGHLLELLRIAKLSGGGRNKKLFQFLNEVGARALRMQLGRVLEMAESSPDKKTYEEKVIQRFGGQLSLDISTYPIS
jgi:hypothetical protein